MRAIFAIALLTACSGGEVELFIQLPDQHRDEVAALRIRTLEPPMAAPFGCNELAFGRIPPAVIEVSTIRQAVLGGADETPLGDLLRARAHVFLAEAVDEDGDLFAIGCAGAEELEDDTVLELILEPYVTVIGTEEQIDAHAPFRLRAIDQFDAPAPGVAAAWVTTGAGGRVSEASGATGPDGVLEIDPGVSSAPGPFVVDVSVRWSDDNPFRAEGFIPPSPIYEMLPPIEDVALIDGGLALLVDGPGGTALLFCSGTEVACGPSIPIGPPATLASLGDRVLVATENVWYTARPGMPVPEELLLGAPIPVPDQIVAAGPCPGATELLFDYGPASTQVFDLEGRTIERLELGDAVGELLASGCAETLDGDLARAYVLRNEEGETDVLAHRGTELFVTEWLVDGEAIVVGDGRRGPLLGTQYDLDEVVISQVALDLFDGELFLEPIDADYPPGFPLRTAGGDVDGDGGFDVVSLLSDFEGGFLVWIALDAESAGERISGAMPIEGLCDNPELFVVDQNVVIIDRGAPGCGDPVEKIVLPMR
jgi:hypothetical protein